MLFSGVRKVAMAQLQTLSGVCSVLGTSAILDSQVDFGKGDHAAWKQDFAVADLLLVFGVPPEDGGAGLVTEHNASRGSAGMPVVCHH